jgi:hypothetical protein
MEVALRRRLEGVADIAISQGQQTADVRFEPGPHRFDPKVLRAAVSETGIEVLDVDVEACGRIAVEGDRRWLEAGQNRFIVANPPQHPALPIGEAVCVNGRLDDSVDPVQLLVSAVTRP